LLRMTKAATHDGAAVKARNGKTEREPGLSRT
jgi:hypothetical protein